MAEIESDIERTRRELGETVEQLAAKVDVRSRAKRHVDRVKTEVATHIEEARDNATAHAHRAKDALTEHGLTPNRNGWVAIVFSSTAVRFFLIALIRRRRG
ncbi:MULTISPECIES: DUF3618 domain-containing protein [unclassified Microbacterium]|uniref:DUF3618 domain-containing protein n=1 Tax=unclassified Microbacterium TaxID=2609290 RepID=UPI0038632029